METIGELAIELVLQELTGVRIYNKWKDEYLPFADSDIVGHEVVQIYNREQTMHFLSDEDGWPKDKWPPLCSVEIDIAVSCDYFNCINVLVVFYKNETTIDLFGPTNSSLPRGCCFKKG